MFLHALRLIPDTHPAIVLTQAWLRQKVGEDTFTLLVEPLLKEIPKPSISSPLHNSDTGAWTAERLSQKLAISAAAARTELKALVGAKLIKELRAGTYKCPCAGAIFEFPSASTSKTAEKLRKIRERVTTGGQEIFSRRGILRAEVADFMNYLPLMALNLSAAAAYGVNRETVKTAIYSVECRAVKVLDF